MFKTKNLAKIYMLVGFLTIFAPVSAMFKYAQQSISPLTKQKLLKTQEELQQAQEEARTQQSKSQRSKQCYNLLMIMDEITTEKKDSDNQSMGLKLASCLSLFAQKNFPIIVSSNIVYNICFHKNNLDKNIPIDKEHLRKIYGPYLTPLISMNLTDSNWYCYDNPDSDVMLFVPKNYLAQFMTNISSTSFNDPVATCGFNTAYLKKINDLSPATLVTYIEENKKKNKTMPFIQTIESMFDIPTEPNVRTWNIYLTGHGGPFKSSIAGLKEGEFKKLLHVFQKINCSYLHYCTCYAGGYNQEIVKNELSQLNVDFIASTQGINEESTYGFMPSFVYSTFSAALTNFFKITESFFGNPERFIQERTQQASWEKDPITSIVGTVIDKSALDYTQPFVYIPTVGVFNALTVDKSVKIVTELKAKTYEFENRTIDFTDPAIQTIMIYANYIGVPLKIKDHTAIVSLTNTSSVDLKLLKQPVIHIFEKIIYYDTLVSMISNSVSFNKRIGSTTFMIKELQCFDYHNSGLGDDYKNLITIKNVIISSGMEIVESVPTISISVYFNYNGKDYYLDKKNINWGIEAESKDSSVEIFKSLENVQAKEISLMPNRQTNGLLSGFMPYLHNYLVQFHNEDIKPQTTAEIVSLLETTIDKTTHVQEPGLLKKVLLRKQQNILEKESHELALKAQKKRFEQQNEPTSSYVRYLEKLKEKAEVVDITDPLKKEEINQTINKEYAAALAAQQSMLKQQTWTDYFKNKMQQFFNTITQYSNSAAQALKKQFTKSSEIQQIIKKQR